MFTYFSWVGSFSADQSLNVERKPCVIITRFCRTNLASRS